MPTNMQQLVLTIIFFTFSTFSFSQTVTDYIECDGCIWLAKKNITNDYDILEWNPANQQIDTTNVAIATNDPNLAVGYVKISNDELINTFITSDFGSGNLKYWYSEKWLDLGFPSISNSAGIGSFENHLWVKTTNRLTYYNTDSSSEEFDISNTNSGFAADVAVDNLGRAWYVTSSSGIISDYIRVLSPDGDMNAYKLDPEIEGFNIYGITNINGTIYLGAGSNNISYPNQIIKIRIENDEALINDQSIAVDVELTISDLASNKPGNPEDIASDVSDLSSPKAIKLYPNPTDQFVNIEGTDIANKKCMLYSIYGEVISEHVITDQAFQLSMSALPKGSYIIKIDSFSKLIIRN